MKTAFTGMFDLRVPIMQAPIDSATGDVEAMTRYAGQSVRLVSEVLPAREIVERVASDAERILRALADTAGA